MRQHRLYKSVWYWNEEGKRLSVFGNLEKEKTKQTGTQHASTNKLLERPQKPTGFFFIENVDQNQQMLFRQKYQRGLKPFIPHIVTMEDIKNTIIFLANGYVPEGFMQLFCSNKMNKLFRAVIVYIQLYLKVWEDLEYRSTSYGNHRLKHPISIERETLCKTYLSKLRSRIGQEYALIIAGEGQYKQYHHMNNTLNRSYTDQDMVFYNYLSIFITRIVWISLNRSNFKEIEMEIFRLFSFKDVNRSIMFIKSKENEDDRKILQGDGHQRLSKWYKQSPVVLDIFIKQEIPEIILSSDENELKLERTRITGIEAALILPEELLSRFGITLGILGQPRDNFEPLLTLKQKQKTPEEEELEKIRTSQTVEIKPKVKMYEYINELEATIDLENADETADIIGEINLYEKSHKEDCKKSYLLWKQKLLRSSRTTSNY